jgi:ketosteroid isomerase-like protein
MRTVTIAVLAAAAALTACKPAPANDAAAMQASDDSVKTYIDNSNAAFSRAMVSGNMDTILMPYAPNATLMMPNMAPVSGADNIRAAMTGMMAEGKPTAFEIKSENVVVSGPMAIERGRYTMSYPMGTATHADSGKFLVHWHNVGGKWVIVDDIWNSDLPPMVMPAPARRRS